MAELQKRYIERQQEPPQLAVILIDSLDEAVTTTGDKNIVSLLAKLYKSDLPDWVRFILTSRPEEPVLREFESLKPYYLEETSEQSLKDVKEYIHKRVVQPKLQQVLQKAQVKTQNFTGEIAKLSSGIFLYTELLLNDIEAGWQPINNLSALPRSIDSIYHNFLKRFSDKEWQKQDRPILGTLAVTREPITEKQLANFTNIDREELRDYLRVVRQFLHEQDEKDKESNKAYKTYAIFHRSLRDYLLDEKRNRDFWCDAKKYHNLIVNYYKEGAKSGEEVNWGKLEPDKDNKYGLLHLSKHLNAAGREQELDNLLTASPKWMNEKFKVFSSDLPYIEDLELAINRFSDPLESAQLLALTKLYTASLVVHQRANIYQDTDLKTLVWLGRKTEEALSYARLRATPEQKLTSLLIIYNALQDTEQSNSAVLDEATKVAREEIEDTSWSTPSLRDLVMALIQAGQLTEGEEISQKISNDSFEKVEVWGELATALGKNEEAEKANYLFKEAEAITGKIEDSSFKFEALLYLATALAKTGETEKANHLFSVAEDLTEKIESTLILSTPLDLKVERLLDLATALAHTGHEEKARLAFGKVRELANGIEDKNDWQRVEILRNLATSQAQSGGEFAHEAQMVFDELKELAYGIKEDNWKAQSLRDLANALAQAGKADQGISVFSEGINIPNTIEEGWERVAILRMFAENLVSSGLTEEAVGYFLQAKEAIQTIPSRFARAEELRKLATDLVQNKFPDQAREVFSEAEELAPNIEQGQKTEQVLSRWAVILSEAGFRGKARAICPNTEKFSETKQEMYEDREWREKIRELAESYTQNKTLTENRTKFLQAINRAGNSAEVREIAETAIKSEYFICQTLGGLVINIAEGREFSIARKVAYAIEDDLMQIEVMKELAKVVAWLGYFKEAFTILGLKNGLIQFLDDLGDWIWASEPVEPKLSLEILQETTSIFGWIYPYWGEIYDQLVSASIEADFPIWEEPITSFNNKLKEELNSQNLHISNIFPTIPPEEAQRFEACIQEAVEILYQNIDTRELTSLANIDETVLKQMIQSINTKIPSTKSFG